MTMLIADASLRATVGARAQGRVQREYLWDGVTRQLEDLYLELAAPEGMNAPKATHAAVSGNAA